MGRALVWGTVERKVRWGRLEKVANNHKQTTIGKIKREARRREREREVRFGMDLWVFNNGFSRTMGG